MQISGLLYSRSSGLNMKSVKRDIIEYLSNRMGWDGDLNVDRSGWHPRVCMCVCVCACVCAWGRGWVGVFPVNK
jgi:hypothetical protein